MSSGTSSSNNNNNGHQPLAVAAEVVQVQSHSPPPPPDSTSESTGTSTSSTSTGTTTCTSINNDYDKKREAEFLASQQARLDKLRDNNNAEHHQGGDADDTSANVAMQRKEFWIILKNVCSSLNTRLGVLIGEEKEQEEQDKEEESDGVNCSNNVNEEKRNYDQSQIQIQSKSKSLLYVTAQQRNEALNKLQEVQFTIRCLGHYTLRSSKFTTTNTNTNSDTQEVVEQHKYLPKDFVNFTMPDLPNADLRLLNTEIEKLKSKAQLVQDIILPKEKFRFKRYRQAQQAQARQAQALELELELKEQKQKKGGTSFMEDEKVDADGDADEDGTIGNESSSAAAHQLKFDGITLADKSNCYIRVHNDGHFTVSEDDAQIIIPLSSTCSFSSKNENENENETTTTTRGRAFLMRDLDSCQILVEGSYGSLHIINSKNTTIRINTPISGPCHVTNCNDSKITLSFCRQLRIHDCTNVSFYVHVSSGPIIEGCKGMKFYQCDYVSKCNKGGDGDGDNDDDGDTNNNFEKEQNLYWDVKDFYWLKNLVKSPNFDVYSMEEQEQQHQQHQQQLAAERQQQKLHNMEVNNNSEMISTSTENNAGGITSADLGVVSQDEDGSSDEDEL